MIGDRLGLTVCMVQAGPSDDDVNWFLVNDRIEMSDL